jgi:sortase A
MNNTTNIKKVLWNIVNGLKFFVILFAFSFTIINFPALWINAKYFFAKHPANVALPTKSYLMAFDNRLIIPKLNINVPITWNVPESNDLAALENGVAQYQGTALPGQTGNVFIYGHSSYYWWDKGSYKEIFAVLSQLKPGDKIYVTYQGKPYTYTVIDQREVKPSQVEVLEQPNDHILSLMTCTPIGTTLNRLIVTARELKTN